MKKILFALLLFVCQIANSQNKLYPIEIKGLWGYMDGTGKMVIQPQYLMADEFNEGYAVAALGNLPCLINLQNKRVIDTGIYQTIGLYSEGLCFVKDYKNHKYFVDSTGKKIIVLSDSTYDARPFKNGLAVIGQQYDKHEIKFNVDISTIAFRFAYIDKKGNLITPFKFDDADDMNNGTARVKKGEKFGVINMKGEQIIDFQFSRIDLFYGSKAAALKDGRFGFIDESGKWIIQPQFEIAFDFNEGLAGVMINGKYGFINEKGEVVIQPVYEQIRTFSEGMAAVQLNGMWGFINTKGEIVIPYKFDNATVFSEGYCAVLVKRKWGFISKTGSLTISPEFDAVGSFEKGIADVVYHDISLYIDMRGNILPKLQ